MAEEIIFSEYQAEVFNEAEMLLRTQGYLGEQLFEDTYVLQKRVADWVIDNVPVAADGSTIADEAMMTYNGVLGIAVDDAVPPVIDNPVKSEPVKPDLPTSVRPTLPVFQPTAIRTTPVRPVRAPKPAIATPIAKPAPKPASRPVVPTSVRRASTTKRNTGLFGGITNIGRNNGLFGGFGGFGFGGRR